MKKIFAVLIVLIIFIEFIFPVISLGTNSINETKDIDLNEITNKEVNSDNSNLTTNELVDSVNKIEEDNVTSNNDKSENNELLNNQEEIESEFSEKEDAVFAKSEEEVAFDDFSSSKMQVVYMSYVGGEGWQNPVIDGETAGTTGLSKTISGMKIKLANAPTNGRVKYKIYDDNGWGETLYDGELAGDSELDKKIYGIKIELENMSMYTIQYRVHVQDYGWLNWCVDGAIAGKPSSKFQIEAIEIRIISVVDKTAGVKYRTYVENEGWQDEVKNGVLSGTVGQCKEIYRVEMDLDNATVDSSIKYQIYSNKHGWTDWYSDGSQARFSDNDVKIEAIKIKIEGLDEYDIKYRAHVQDVGWQSWVKNGQLSGTEGKNKRIEALEIKLSKKQTNDSNSIIKPSVSYSSHIQDIGWEKDFSKSDGQLSGTTGRCLRIEAIKIKLLNAPNNARIKYSSYVEGKGWQDNLYDGKTAGTTGKSLKLLGLKVELENMEDYSVMYRIHVQDIGWKSWKKDGAITEAIEQSKRIEAIQIKLISKSEGLSVAYSSHIQDIGWENDFSKCNGDLSGTSGRSLRIEAIKLKLTGNEANTGIQYRTYIENKGWQSWKSNGKIAGTTGESLKLLGIQIELINMPTYSIQYRVHIQDYGWSNWEVDGNTLGKISYNKRIEAIQARIVHKTVSYPKSISYTSRVQGAGWEEDWLHKNGEISGTTGKGLEIHGFKLKLENYGEEQEVEYNLHVQNLGWLGWTTKEHLSSADGLRLEAIKIRLKNMDNYTVEYRTHVQDIGWQDWMLDGETAGTTGKGKRVEAIQIRIVPKYYRNLYGVDVSWWNHDINWRAVKNDGINFAIIRCGYGQESSQKDSTFEPNYRNARAVNIKLGSYLYSYAKSVEDARKEAYNCLAWLAGRPFEFPIFFDLEDPSQKYLGARTLTDMTKEFCRIIHNAGYKTGLYSYYSWLTNNIYLNELPEYCDIWLAHYTGDSNKKTDYPGRYEIWQYSSEGHVDGINGNVDVNIGYKNY